MKVCLAKYSGLRICVAVSGGKDSMALLHYIYSRGGDFGIKLSALNCEHGIRGESSSRDSAFVSAWCKERGIPLLSFSENCPSLAKKRGISVETAAREWRHNCYFAATSEGFSDGWEGADAVATAHHMNDNAETVLFNLARGSSVAGVCGISDCEMSVREESGIKKVKLIRPLIACTRGEIDEYIETNDIPFVEDESNFRDEYTRNRIRLNVIPELERAVPSAVEAIYRFSRLAAVDEEYFAKKADGLIEKDRYGDVTIKYCGDYPVFSRAAVKVIKDIFMRKDYTFEIIERIFALQCAANGDKFEFLGLTAYKEEAGVAVSAWKGEETVPIPFGYGNVNLCGLSFAITERKPATDERVLKFDCSLIPDGAVLRTRRIGDRIKKFGGGTKSLGDFFTDKKIPLRLRDRLPVVASDSEILAVCGLEISENIKVTDKTETVGYISEIFHKVRLPQHICGSK